MILNRFNQLLIPIRIIYSYIFVFQAEGNDFYSSPRVSPDGKQLAWITWVHNNMVSMVMLNGFKSCLLYTSDAADEGLGVDLGGRRII